MKITKSTIGPYPQPGDILAPMPTVRVTYEDGSTEDLFSFYPDEINFAESEFVGLTRDQAMALRQKKDSGYLRAGSYTPAVVKPA